MTHSHQNRDLEPLVVAITRSPAPDGLDVLLELNIVCVPDLVAFDWSTVVGRRVVIVAGNSPWHAAEAEKCRRAAVAARASSVGVVARLAGCPDGFDLAQPLPPRLKPEAIRSMVRSAELRVNAAGLPDLGLLTAARKPVPSFDLGVFPREVQKAIRIQAAAAGAPIGFVATSLLTTAAGLSSAALSARVRAGWEEPLILWGVILGDPSSNKSPSQRCTERVVALLEAEKAKEAATLAAFAEDEKARPAHIVLRLSDATVPSIYMMAGAQGRVPFLHTHEGGTFIANVAASWKGNSSDRGAMNALYDGKGLSWFRRTVSKAPIYISRAACSVLLCAQPDAVAGTIGPEAVSDGLMERFLWDFSDAADRTLSAPSQAGLDWADAVFEKILRVCEQVGARSYADPLSPEATVCEFTPSGADFFEQWRGDLFDTETREQGRVSAATGKAPGHAARLALALHLIAHAAGEDGAPLPLTIDDAHVAAGCALRGGYYQAHYERVLADATMTQDDKLATALARHIMKARPATLDPVGLRVRDKVPGLTTTERVLCALRELAARNWLAVSSVIPHPRDWRADTPEKIQLHPRLFELIDAA